MNFFILWSPIRAPYDVKWWRFRPPNKSGTFYHEYNKTAFKSCVICLVCIFTTRLGLVLKVKTYVGGVNALTLPNRGYGAAIFALLVLIFQFGFITKLVPRLNRKKPRALAMFREWAIIEDFSCGLTLPHTESTIDGGNLGSNP